MFKTPRPSGGLATPQNSGKFHCATYGIYQEYTLEDFEQERQALKELGL